MNTEKGNALEELNKILSVLFKHIKLIIFVAIIGVVVSVLINTFAIKPQYQSTAEMIVNQKTDKNVQSDDQQSVSTELQFINTYKSILNSQTISDSVSSKVGANDYGQSKLSVSTDNNSQVIEVSVTANNPKVASRVANVTASTFKQKVTKILNVNNVSIISKAKPNNGPVSPDKKSNMLMGLLIGIVAGILLALLKEYNAKTIDSKEYITDELGLMDLGTIGDIDVTEIKKQGKH